MKPNIHRAACLIALALAVSVIAASSTLGPGSISSAYAARSPQAEATPAAPPSAPPPADASIDEIDAIDKAESITLEPSAATVTANDTQYFVATVRDKNGKVISNASVKWSANAAAGRILLSGKLAATFQATTTVGFYPSAVTARADNVSASANINVTPSASSAVTRIEVSPTLVVMVVNSTQSFTATGYDAQGNPVSGLNLAWSASPGSGVIVSSGPTTATFRASTSPGLYSGAVRATNGSVTGTAAVDVRAGSPATVIITPTVVTLAINATQPFAASVYDQYGNLLSVGVTWLTPSPYAGAIQSSSALTAVFRAGTVAGTFPNGLRAANSLASANAAITIPPDTPTQLQISATPDSIATDGVNESTIVVTVTDSYGNPVGAGTAVTLNVVQCDGSCALGATSLETDAQGRVTTTLRSTYKSVTETVNSSIIVTASINTLNGPVSSEPLVVHGSFTPYRSRLPILANGEPDNHTACTALPISPPATVDQPANNAFNIYRFSAAATSYNVAVYNYATAGQLLLYGIAEDNCAASGTMQVDFIKAIPITSSTTFLTTLSGMFAPGQSYLLAVNTTGALTLQIYTLNVRP